MFLFKKNPYNGKMYRYDTDEHDIFTDMFDDKLHETDVEPSIEHPNICAYCHTCFLSRNQLFYHLGYMGIDIRDPRKAMSENNEETEDQKRLCRKRRWLHNDKLRSHLRDRQQRSKYYIAKRNEKKQRIDDIIDGLITLTV